MRKIHPNLSPIRPCDGKYRLAMRSYSADLTPSGLIDNQDFMLSDSRQEKHAAGAGPTLEMRHFVNGQFFPAAAITIENPADATIHIPEIQQCQPILSEQTGNIITAVPRNQAVIRQAPDILEFADARVLSIR